MKPMFSTWRGAARALTVSAASLATPALAAATTAPVSLGAAGHYVILTKTGITDVAASAVIGNVGTSPITGAADHLTCTEVTGRIFSVDAAGPAPCSIPAPGRLRVAVGDMQTAYTDAAGRTATVTELGAGNIGGLTLPPAVYKWSSGVIIPTSVTLAGGPNDVWILQVAQNVNIASGQKVQLRGGARAKNVFWQVAGKVTIGTTAHFRGVVLCKTLIAMKTGAVLRGRLYSQTAVTLEQNQVTRP
jgi:hypothetical protein